MKNEKPENTKKEDEIEVLSIGGEDDDTPIGINGSDNPSDNPEPIKDEITIIPDEETAAELAKQKADASEIFANPLSETHSPDEILIVEEAKGDTVLDKAYDWLFNADPMEGLE